MTPHRAPHASVVVRFADSTARARTADLADLLAIPPAEVWRAVRQMEALGFLTPAGDGTYLATVPRATP